MDVKITKSNGDTFLLSEYAITAQDFNVESIALIPHSESIEGRSGLVDMGADYGTRTISVPFYLSAYDLAHYALLRDFFYGVVTDVEPFYIEEYRRRNYDDEYNVKISGKRYKVRLSSTVNLDQIFRYGFGELQFMTTDLPFAESIGTTQDIENSGIDANDELWGEGMGLIAEDEALKYIHTGTSFRIYNAGDVPVNPFEQFINITISNVSGSSSYLRIRNVTNGSEFRVTQGVNNGDVITVDGADVKRNGLAFLRNTTRAFIELSPGWNEFAITGANSAQVAFDFRFYYK